MVVPVVRGSVGTSGSGRRWVSPWERRRHAEGCREPPGTEPGLEVRTPTGLKPKSPLSLSFPFEARVLGEGVHAFLWVSVRGPRSPLGFGLGREGDARAVTAV